MIDSNQSPLQIQVERTMPHCTTHLRAGIRFLLYPEPFRDRSLCSLECLVWQSTEYQHACKDQHAHGCTNHSEEHWANWGLGGHCDVKSKRTDERSQFVTNTQQDRDRSSDQETHPNDNFDASRNLQIKISFGKHIWHTYDKATRRSSNTCSCLLSTQPCCTNEAEVWIRRSTRVATGISFQTQRVAFQIRVQRVGELWVGLAYHLYPSPCFGRRLVGNYHGRFQAESEAKLFFIQERNHSFAHWQAS